MSWTWKRDPEDIRLPFLAPRTNRDEVVAQVAALAQAGALDAGNGDVLDGWLEGLRTKQRAQVLTDRTERIAAAQAEVSRLEAEAEEARFAADVVAERLDRTRRELSIAEKRVLGPADAQSVEKRERRSRPRPTVDALEGLVPSRGHSVVMVLLILLAAAGDLVTFRLTLAGFTASQDWIVWTLTVAFAAVSVGLMHAAGRALKDLRQARGGSGRVALGFMIGAWVLLGGVATYFRSQVATPSSQPADIFGADTAADAAAASHEALLSAVLLAGLYIASGVLAFYAGFSEHHPHVRTYRELAKRVVQQRKQLSGAEAAARKATHELAHARGKVAAAVSWADDALATTDAEIAELKELVRVEVAGHLGLPEATNGLTTGRRVGGAHAAPRTDVPEPRAGDDGAQGVPGPPPLDARTPRRIPREVFPLLTPRSVNSSGSLNGSGS
ncbi:hypothetical protein [Geodermatophilus sp. SYSU D01176]